MPYYMLFPYKGDAPNPVVVYDPVRRTTHYPEKLVYEAYTRPVIPNRRASHGDAALVDLGPKNALPTEETVEKSLKQMDDMFLVGDTRKGVIAAFYTEFTVRLNKGATDEFLRKLVDLLPPPEGHTLRKVPFPDELPPKRSVFTEQRFGAGTAFQDHAAAPPSLVYNSPNTVPYQDPLNCPLGPGADLLNSPLQTSGPLHVGPPGSGMTFIPR